ncbi:MAG TPA: bifunctional oligoribonuclease/PAP phosphatase NrnA [Acidimicrobiales bacterium]
MTMNVDEQLEQAAAVISDADEIALACHLTPDGDALGSLLAMLHLCRANQQGAVASWPEPFNVAPHYRFLPGLDLAVPPASFPEEPDVMLTFDCGSMARLAELGDSAKRAGTLIVLDHHATNDCYGAINVVDPEAAATAVMVYRLAKVLGWRLDRDAALCLYTGLVTDTGRFQYQNTTPEVFDLASELARFDLPIAEMTRELFEKHRFVYLRLVGEALARAELDERLGFVGTFITQDDLDRHGVSYEEVEGLIDLVRRTAEAEVSCVAKEAGDERRVSLRSISEVDVATIAEAMGGGGHRFAAGFTTTKSVAEIFGEVKDAVAAQRAATIAARS